MAINNNENTVNLVNNSLLNYIHEDVNFARDYLLDNGFDMDKERALGLKELRKRIALAKGYEKQISDGSLLSLAMKQIREINLSRDDQNSAALQSLLVNSAVGLQFRNLEDWSDAQIKEALGDVDLIKLLEKLKKLK